MENKERRGHGLLMFCSYIKVVSCAQQCEKVMNLIVYS